MEQPQYFSEFSEIRFERRSGILQLTLHTADGPVTWSDRTGRELERAFDQIAKDSENRVIILTGTGDVFVPRRPATVREYDGSSWFRAWARGTSLIMNFLRIPVPVIAALNGPCHLHLEIPLLADMVIVTEDTEFSDSAHLPTGMVPGDGMHVIMP